MLSRPAVAGRCPCVVMIHGSGPQDRDGNIQGFRTRIFALLAAHLAGHGIASLRYDKRGCGKSEGEFLAAGLSDFVADAGAAIKFASGHGDAQFDCIFVLGHSEGAVLVPEICLRNPGVAGAIMLCASLRSLEDDLVKNAEILNTDLAGLRGLRGMLARWLFHTSDARASVESLRRKVFGTTRKTVRVSFSRVSTKFYRETFEYDVKAQLAQVRQPILAIGGGKDFQCLPEDTRLIAGTTSAPVQVAIVESMNHLLRNQQGAPSMLRYKAQSDEPLASEVGSLVVDWIGKASGG